MAGVSGGLLAAQVSNAGGLGFIAAGHFQNVDELEAEIQIYSDVVNTAIDARPCIGFIGHSSLKSQQGWDNYEYILGKYKPRAIQFFAPSIVTSPVGVSNVKLAQKYGAKFVAQVGSIQQAKEVIEHGVDAIICQGGEAGGHGLRRDLANSTMALSSQVSNLTDIPVVAAGGIVKGKHLASVLCVCDGASIGTRLWASTESLGSKLLQKELIKGHTCDDVVKTSVFDQIENEMKDIKWPYPFDASGALRNDTTKEWENRSRRELSEALQNTNLLEKYKVAMEGTQTAVITNYSGEGIGEINSIVSAYELILQIESDAIATIRMLQQLVV
jgi:nitronate monooxygenase